MAKKKKVAKTRVVKKKSVKKTIYKALWIMRDDHDIVWCMSTQPHSNIKNCCLYAYPRGDLLQLPSDWYPDVKFGDEPLQVSMQM